MAADFQAGSDEELARQCQAGSLAAFEALVYRYEDRIYGFVASNCRNHADAREITQDTFVRAFQAIDQFDCRLRFSPWLFTIARRKCIDRHRAEPASADAPLLEPPDEDDPAELLARRDERENLWNLARRRLPASQFQTLWLKYAEEMDVAEIAQVLRKTRTHIKVLLFRARQTLGRALRAGQGTELPRKGAVRRIAETAERAPLPGACERNRDSAREDSYEVMVRKV